MKRILVPIVLAAVFMAGTGSAGAEGEGPRFAEVTLRLITMGEKQPLKEVGVFSSSLPMGKAGGLHRVLSIANETKGTGLTLALGISVTPSLDDQGVLHCVVLSEATPEGSSAFQRAKDMTFLHAGEQVMELFADSRTGTRLALAVSATAVEQRPRSAPESFPPITFLVRVEQWSGAQRAEIESLQLQSLGGASVSHDYQRKVPRWVEDATPAAGQDVLSLDDLPVLDMSSATPTVKAGQGFSIPLSPKEQESQRKKAGREEAKALTDQGVSNMTGPSEKPKEKPRKITWDQEFYHLSVEPVAMRENELAVRLVLSGQILDPVTKQPAPPLDLKVEKNLKPGQPTPFYLTRDVSGGAQGFVVWVIPQWSIVPPLEMLLPTPAAPGPAAPNAWEFP